MSSVLSEWSLNLPALFCWLFFVARHGLVVGALFHKTNVAAYTDPPYQAPPLNLARGVPNLARPATTEQSYRRDALPASDPTRPGADLARRGQVRPRAGLMRCWKRASSLKLCCRARSASPSRLGGALVGK